MGTLPQLIEEDIQVIDSSLTHLLAHTEARAALILDKGGFLITNAGDSSQFDLTSMAALASGAYMATETIANLVHESNFNSVYQQGEKHSMFVLCIDENCLMMIVFKSQISVGLVKYFALPAAEAIAAQLKKAGERDPSTRLDLSVLNMADSSVLFRRKS